MSRIAYVNGRYVPHADAAVHIEDRGYQFADGVYEVVAVFEGKFVDEALHLARLWRSLSELRIAVPMTEAALSVVMRQVVRRNRVRDGIIYMQMTRGVAPRDHGFPANPQTQVVMTSRRAKPTSQATLEAGVRVITIPDIRWTRSDIKSVSLLPVVLGKQAARDAGAYEAWQVDRDGFVTEGTSTNAWIVTQAGELVTRAPYHGILNGITRLTLIEIAKRQGLTLVERPFTVAEAKAAREAFVSSATSLALPVSQIDDAVIGNGRAGSFALGLREQYLAYAAEQRKAG
ncbi:MAG TPA: D-amino-acid transaminase [Stellaceae bacterium]|nr:D-amino-acid transaminase [Stellaceae bacterium]